MGVVTVINYFYLFYFKERFYIYVISLHYDDETEHVHKHTLKEKIDELRGDSASVHTAQGVVTVGGFCS